MWDAAQGYKKQQTVRHTKMRFVIPTTSADRNGYMIECPGQRMSAQKSEPLGLH
jgi:hypothetical protein